MDPRQAIRRFPIAWISIPAPCIRRDLTRETIKPQTQATRTQGRYFVHICASIDDQDGSDTGQLLNLPSSIHCAPTSDNCYASHIQRLAQILELAPNR